MKKIILSVLIAWCIISSLCAQSLLIECWYNVNGYAHQALISLNGSSGRCHVVSSNGDCWYSVYYNRYDTYTAISMSNPSKGNWIPGTIYFVQGGNDYIDFQGYKFSIRASVIQEQYWSMKLNQYGFNTPSFRGGDKYKTFAKTKNRCSKCLGCTGYWGYKHNNGAYEGNCSNSDGWGHTCGHGPEKHGLRKW